MCKVGGPRCDGSHKPSSTQRAKRKANKKYRRALADEIESKTGDADLAKRVRQANMTDLHEVAMLAGINEASIAKRCGTATYTAPDGETVTVDVVAPGQTRRIDADAESKQLFDDVFVAASKRNIFDEGSELDQALMSGDRSRAAEIADELEGTDEWVHATFGDRDAIRDMTDKELIGLAAESSKRLNEAQMLAGADALDPSTRIEAKMAESALARRGLRADGTKFDFEPESWLQRLEKKDDESEDYTTARRLSEEFANNEDFGIHEDYIRNAAMYRELAARTQDEDARAKLLEMAERMDHRAALNGTSGYFTGMESNAFLVQGVARAATIEGRSDEALSDMYDEIASHRDNNPGSFEDMALRQAQITLGRELDRRGGLSDQYARDEMAHMLKFFKDEDPAEMSDERLAEVMDRLTTARGVAYSRSENPEVRAEADALAGPIAEEYGKRVATMDDLTHVPAYMWPEDTEGKTLPSKDELRRNAEFYYGLRDVSRNEAAGLADDRYDANAPSFVGMDPAGNAIYRDGATMYRMAQPSAGDIPNDAHRRDYNTLRLMDAQMSGSSATMTDLDDVSDAKAFSAAATAYDALGDTDNGRLGGALARAAQAKQFLDSHPAREDTTRFDDDEMHVLADRARAATETEEHVRGSKRAGVDDHMIQTYAAHKASQERMRFAKALDSQLRRGGTYTGFVDEHGMTYEQAFKVVEDHESKGVTGGRQVSKVKDELVAAAREGREPKFRTIDNAMKPSAADTAEYEKAREIVDTVERAFGTEDNTHGGGYMFSHNVRTAATWSQAGTSKRFSDIIDREDTMYPTNGASFKSKADADVAAAYVRHQSAGKIAQAIAGDTDTVRADGTYSEARVPRGRVSDGAVSTMLTAVEENVLDSYEHGDDAMRGITRNSSGTHDAKVAARNYQAVYAHAVSRIGSEHEYEAEAVGSMSPSERADFDEVARTRAAYVERLGVLYDRAEAGDTDAAEELIETAAASYADDESFMRTRQYVDPDQESLF